ncbi:MAG: MmgE/PrpD family protein [Actinomycetota bacterium]
MTDSVRRLATWATRLSHSDVPEDVLELCRAQRRSVLAAIGASTGNEAAGRVLEGVVATAPDGPVPIPGTGRSARVEDALYAAAAASVALDFDDYMCFGHTGHSAVLVPLLLAAETQTGGAEQIAAQAAANEIEARLGGACLIGPLNGQMWSHIHAAGAAVAAARLMELDENRSAHALAIALHQPPRPSVAGFMGADTKLLIAAEPALAGLRAARLAAAGVTGPLDALDHRSGFFGAFSFEPIRGLLSGLGEGWATRTLSVKARPGCAYVHSALDALFRLGASTEVKRVIVDAGVLTCGMEALSAPWREPATITPVGVTFSVAWSAAVALLVGSYGPDELTEKWISEHVSELDSLARRVEVRHDPRLSALGARSFARLIPPRLVLGEVGRRRLLRAVLRMRAEHPKVRLSARDAVALLRGASGAGTSSFWDPASLADFRMALPARVTVIERSGTRRSAEVEVPEGGAGHPEIGPVETSVAKLAAWGPRLWGQAGMEKIAAAVDADGSDLHAFL